MAGNAAPIYSAQGELAVNGVTTMPIIITSAVGGDYQGTSAGNSLVFTADATNGSYVQRVRGKAAGTNVASVVRLFLNNGATNGTSGNNCFFGEFSLPATTAINTAAAVEVDYPLNFALPPGFRIYAGLGTAVAGGWQFTVIGGNY